MGGSYFPVVPKPPFWHLDAFGWEPSTASKAEVRDRKPEAGGSPDFNWQQLDSTIEAKGSP